MSPSSKNVERKHIGVFFDAPNYDDYPFDVDEFRIAYHEIAQEIEKLGSQFHIVRDISTFLGGNRFKGHWVFDNGAFNRRDEDIVLDLIYDKGMFVGDEHSRLLNSVSFDRLCIDKLQTVLRFSQYSPKTVVVKSAKELKKALQAWSGDTIVVKPVDGAEAEGVVIGSRNIILASDHDYPLLVQQFIDTHNGIPRLVEGISDMRVIVIDGEIALTYLRRAKTGTLISNVSKGGLEIEVLPKDRPEEVLAIVRDIDDKLCSMSRHRIYCVDLARDKDGRWYIIELNSKPGLSVRSYGVTYPRYQDLLVRALVTAARE